MKIEVGLGDCIGRKPAIRQATAVIILRRSTDLPVDDDVSDVNAARPQFPRHALRQRAQRKLWRCKVGEVGRATQ